MPARGAALCRPESAPGGRARPFSLRIGSRGASYHGAYGGGPDAAAAPVLGRRARGGRARPGAADPRARPARPARVDAPEGHARSGRVQRGRGAARGARGDRLPVRSRARAGRGDVLVPARWATDQEDGALVPDATAREGRRARPRGGRGGVARAGRGAPPASLRLGPTPRRGARLGRREETGAVPPGDLLGHVLRELREPLPDIARGGLDDLPA